MGSCWDLLLALLATEFFPLLFFADFLYDILLIKISIVDKLINTRLEIRQIQIKKICELIIYANLLFL